MQVASRVVINRSITCQHEKTKSSGVRDDPEFAGTDRLSRRIPLE